ncbi:MAG: leucine-rich repeat domain-containing protein, partial [Clostridiales bacterium]|nr:leucine-rich repeat domain-containing protein [Clostridiales bacterium]
MKKIRLFLVMFIILCCSMAFVACGAPELSAPTGLRINENTLLLTWNKVDDAIGYVVNIGGAEKKVRENSYSLVSVASGDYTIRVKSIGDEENYQDSAWSASIKFTREYESGIVYTLINNNSAYEVTRAGTASGDVEIVDTYRGKPVIAIADGAFSGNNRITGIKIGKNVKRIGNRAFSNCTLLTSIEIPNTVVEIGDNTFQSCGNLTEVTLPDSISGVSNFMFAYCRKLAKINWGARITYIGESAFSNCSALGNVT